MLFKGRKRIFKGLKKYFQRYEKLFSALCNPTAVKEGAPPESVPFATVTICHAYGANNHLLSFICGR